MKHRSRYRKRAFGAHHDRARDVHVHADKTNRKHRLWLSTTKFSKSRQKFEIHFSNDETSGRPLLEDLELMLMQ